MDVKRWWQNKNPGIRQDIYGCLLSLREYVEGGEHKGDIILSPMSVFRQRNIQQVHTTKLHDIELGYQIKTINKQNGFYKRIVYIKVLNSRLSDLSKQEFEKIINSVSESVFDKYSEMALEFISDTTMAIKQKFAVTFIIDKNPNILVPSKKLILGVGNE